MNRRMGSGNKNKKESIIREINIHIYYESHFIVSSFLNFSFRLRYDNPAIFAKPELYFEILKMLSGYHFRLTARRFIQDLFERVVFNTKLLETLDTFTSLSPPYDITSSQVEHQNDNSNSNSNINNPAKADKRFRRASHGGEREKRRKPKDEEGSRSRGTANGAKDKERPVLQPLTVLKGGFAA